MASTRRNTMVLVVLGWALAASPAPESHEGRGIIPADPRRSADQLQMRATFPRLPLSFEPNLGQTDPQVLFLGRGPDHTVFVTPTEAVLALRGSAPAQP